ncbi:transketolase [Lachnospiraceae bacterium NE2001]|nr:transketolase [Lachnospiraceae bacterium NE2001]
MNVTSANIRKWSMLGQRGSVFAVAFPDVAENIENLKLVTADLSLLSGMDRFIQKYPEKFLNVGIAEQNMIGISAGLAMSGYNVFATTYASFIAVRSLEFVRQHLSYLGCNVKLIGSSAGVVAAKSGVSHWATEDIAFTRVLPNMQVFSPADSLEAIKVIEYAAKMDGPMYIRLSGGLNCPIVYREDYDFVPGRLVPLKSVKIDESKGPDKRVAVIATGLMVSRTLEAVKHIEEEQETDPELDGVQFDIYNMHTIKPLDKEGLDKIFDEADLVVTVEEHNVLGGMGSTVAEYKTTKVRAPRQVFVGFNDSFYPAGTQDFVLDEAGLSVEKIAERIKAEIR